MSRLLALWIAADAIGRTYAGPTEVVAPTSAELSPESSPALLVEPGERPVDSDELARRVAPQRKPPARTVDCPSEPGVSWKTGGWAAVFLATAVIAELVALGVALDCNGCDDASSLPAGTVVAVSIGVATGPVGQLAFERRRRALHERIVHRGEAVRAPRPGMMAPGILMAIVGVAIAGGGPLLTYDPYGSLVRLGGAGVALGGSIWAGRIRARRLAVLRGGR